MGWFHKAFGFSSQPAVAAVNKAAGQLWDNTGINAIGRGLESVGLKKLGGMVSLPSWDELGKPAEAFYNEFNDGAGILPPSWRQYAAPVVGAALNFVPGVGPLLSAGFNTAYNAGNMQANQKGMDWGAIGKDAAINFGTAALQMGASKALKGAQSAQSSKAFASGSPSVAGSEFSMGAGLREPVGSSLGRGALDSFDLSSELGRNSVGINAAQFAKDSATALSSAKSANAITMPSGASATATPAITPQAAYSPTVVDKAYNKALEGFTPEAQAKSQAVGIGQQMLTDTLAPQGTQPIAGDFEGAGMMGVGGYQPGTDVLGAFGDPQMFTPNASGKRIDAAALERMTQNLGTNAYLQQRDVQDKFVPTGQTEPEPNTPYNRSYTQVNKNQDQAYQDLLKQTDNWNAYYGIQDVNPSFTDEMMQQYIDNPELRPMAQVDGKPMDLFQGITMPNLYNTSFIR
jgi:hypothetical protein